MYARSLGAVATEFDAGFFGADGPSPYDVWAAQVKESGGRVSGLPSQPTIPAAAYAFDLIYPPPDYVLNPWLFLHGPDEWNKDSSIGYFRAPADVVKAAGGKSSLSSFGSGLVGVFDDLKWVVGGAVLLLALSKLPSLQRRS